MHRPNFTALAFVVPAALTLAACGDQRAPTEATRPMDAKVALSREDQHAGTIVAHDDCDAATFNAALNDPNACVKHGNQTFQSFIAELQATGVARSWRFTPEQLTGKFGVGLGGNNVGGEEHTFTPVKAFGGGFFQPLNDLSDNPVPAPECLTLDAAEDLVVAGAKYTIEKEELAEVVDGSGLARVQCCIHPWMRTEVRMKG